MKKNFILIVLILGVLLAIITSIYFFSFVKNDEVIKKITKNDQVLGECLNEDENVSYKFEKKEPPLANVVIRVVDKNTVEEKQFFKIADVFENYHPIELRKCGIYVIKFFNYDPKVSKQKPEFNVEFWKYYYSGEGVKLLSSEDFSYDFRIDPNEKYLVLEKSYLGKDDYSLIIKDLKTFKDVFVLPLVDIVKKNPDFAGSFNMRQWTKDGRYFWGDIFDGADVLAVFRIDSASWKWEVFEVPPYTMGGTALNAEYGYITYDDGPPWTGDVEFDQINKEKWLKEGKKLNFYLYNLFNKKQILLEIVDDPLWGFKPQWLSDIELQYELPSGEKKVYKITS